MFNKTGRIAPEERVRQDPPSRFTLKQQQDRAADELVGLCRGMLSDGVVSAMEAQFLKDWIERNAIHANAFPFDIVYRQLQSALADGVFDEHEEQDLLSTLVNLVGGEQRDFAHASPSLASALPLCQPTPAIHFAGSVFVVTGTFAFGNRRQVIDALESRQASAASSVSKKVNFLVIGEIGSQAWRHSSYGRKIEAAVELREAGVPLRIVSEPHWREALASTS
ncbi:MAG: BRCT domain-containing protein [Xanthomonadales bacterium]|nr:BRCT domain-containing protein [Xanthomonadales bacterium]